MALVVPMYAAENVSLLRKVFEWSTVDAHDIDDEKYALAKRFSEVNVSILFLWTQKLTTLDAFSSRQLYRAEIRVNTRRQ